MTHYLIITLALSLIAFAVVFSVSWAVLMTITVRRVLAESREKDETIRILTDTLAVKPRPVLRLYDWRAYERNARRN